MPSPSGIHSYHAHVYYDPAHTRGAAERLRQRIAERFGVQLGRWHEQPVGPHSAAMYQVAFAPELFARLVPWLMLMHPNTLAPRDDHLQHAPWLGQPRALDAAMLPLRIDARDESPVEPNTTPRCAP